MDSAKYQRRPDVMFTTVSDEVLALDIRQGQCFGMNSVASEMWNLLAEPRSLDDVCTALLARFDVSPARCREEAGALLERFRSEGLVEVQPAS